MAAAVWSRSDDAGPEFPPPSRKRRYQIFAGTADIDGRKLQQSAHLEANLGALGSPTTPHGTPLLERLLQLEQHMDGFEQSVSPRGRAAEFRSTSPTFSLFNSPFTPSSLETRCRSAKSVLLETKAKGTLVERIQRLESRISQHGMDLEKAFSSPGRFGYWSRCDAEYDHMREDLEHLSRSSQETYANNLEVPPPGPALPPGKSGIAEWGSQLTEGAAIRELEANPTSIPSPTTEAHKDADTSESAQAAGKRTGDENAERNSNSESPTPASEMSTDFSAPVTTQVVSEETEGKQGFKHIRERIQEFFRLKETYSAASEGSPSRPQKDGSKVLDSATKAATSRRPATKAASSSRLHRFSSKETDLTRLHRFGSDSLTKLATSRLHRFGSKEMSSATKPSTSRPHRLGLGTL